jgi:hypothetical protein
MKKIGLTGRIGKPLITLDVLLPIGRDSDVYARMVRQAGRSPATTASRAAPTPTPGRPVPGPTASTHAVPPYGLHGPGELARIRTPATRLPDRRPARRP